MLLLFRAATPWPSSPSPQRSTRRSWKTRSPPAAGPSFRRVRSTSTTTTASTTSRRSRSSGDGRGNARAYTRWSSSPPLFVVIIIRSRQGRHQEVRHPGPVAAPALVERRGAELQLCAAASRTMRHQERERERETGSRVPDLRVSPPPLSSHHHLCRSEASKPNTRKSLPSPSSTRKRPKRGWSSSAAARRKSKVRAKPCPPGCRPHGLPLETTCGGR